MGLKLGSLDIDKLYLGSDEVQKLYLGSDLVWEGVNEFPTVSGCVGQWILANNFVDTINGNDAIPTGTIEFGEVDGKQSATFGGGIDTLDMPELAAYATLETSVAMWVRKTSGSAVYISLFQHDNGGANNIAMGLNTSGDVDNFEFRYGIGSGNAISAGDNTVPINTWTHVCGTWDGVTARTYVNGIETNIQGGTGGSLPPDVNTIIVARLTTGNFFTGQLQNLQYYNRAITPEEVEIISGVGSDSLYRDYSGSALFPNSVNDIGWLLWDTGVYTLETVNTRTGSTAIRASGTNQFAEIYHQTIFNGVVNGDILRWQGYVKVGTASILGTPEIALQQVGDFAGRSVFFIDDNEPDWQYFDIVLEVTDDTKLHTLQITCTGGTYYVDDIMVFVNSDLPLPILYGLMMSYQCESNAALIDDLGANDGTNSGTTIETGANGNALGYDGITGFSSVPYDDSIQITDEVTCMVDLYPTALGQSGTSNVIGLFWSQSGNHVYHIGYRATGVVRGRITLELQANTDVVSPDVLTLNEWHRIIFRWKSGEVLRIVVDNGTETLGAVVATGIGTPTTLPFQISMDPTWTPGATTRRLPGRVDNVMCWNRKLTDAEVQLLFDGNPDYNQLSDNGMTDLLKPRAGAMYSRSNTDVSMWIPNRDGLAELETTIVRAGTTSVKVSGITAANPLGSLVFDDTILENNIAIGETVRCTGWAYITVASDGGADTQEVRIFHESYGVSEVATLNSTLLNEWQYFDLQMERRSGAAITFALKVGDGTVYFDSMTVKKV